MRYARPVLVGLTLVMGTVQIIDAFSIDVPVGGIVAGLIFVGLAVWLARTRGSWPAIIIGLLAVLELLLNLFVYPDPGEGPSILVVILSAATAAAAVATVLQARRVVTTA